jgi:hypothetical protein
MFKDIVVAKTDPLMLSLLVGPLCALNPASFLNPAVRNQLSRLLLSLIDPSALNCLEANGLSPGKRRQAA